MSWGMKLFRLGNTTVIFRFVFDVVGLLSVDLESSDDFDFFGLIRLFKECLMTFPKTFFSSFIAGGGRFIPFMATFVKSATSFPTSLPMRGVLVLNGCVSEIIFRESLMLIGKLCRALRLMHSFLAGGDTRELRGTDL